ncbi:hypothetical protein MASR2M78_21620 [Treponema sp.]
MRFVPRAVRSLVLDLIALAPLGLFATMLRAEGPLLWLFAWTAISSLLIHLSITSKQDKRSILSILRALAAFIVLAGLMLILLQVNVAKRSLAEAWLDLARKGEAFGFFSFFAAELYAIFAVGQTALLSIKRPAAFLAAALASNALSAGIILGSTAFMMLAVIAVGMLALSLAAGSIRYRLTTVSVPLAGAVLLASIYAACPTASGSRYELLQAPDLSPVVAVLAPDFPLLVDVPGYGFSVGSGSLSASVYLSTRPLFTVHGEAGTTHYLVNQRFIQWKGTAWNDWTADAAELPILTELPIQSYKTLSLILTEDFFSSIPVENETNAIYLPAGIPEGTKAETKGGVSFSPSARRGTQAYLLRLPLPSPHAPAAEVRPVEAIDPETLDARGNTPRMKALVAQLLEKARADRTTEEEGTPARYFPAPTTVERTFVSLLLSHFKNGYSYSLEVGSPPAKADVNDWFIFERKTGFCVYFASAFTLLARQAGIPARMVEGYRVALDEWGNGVIRGSNAHAWPELLIDGSWRPFEPTPPFASEDPFAYTRDADRTTRRQLESLYGEDAGGADSREASRDVPIHAIAIFVGIGIAIVFGSLYFGLIIFSSERQRTIRRARYLVRLAAKKGVPKPEHSGWLAWQAAALICLGEKLGKNSSLIAERMIEYAYNDHKSR